MKKQHVIMMIVLLTTNLTFSLSDAEAQKKGNDILQVMVGSHTTAFGHANLLKVGSLDINTWNQAIAEMKNFVTTIINEHTNFFGMKDSTLTSALEKITKAEIDLVNAIKVSRAVINSPSSLEKQIAIFNKIINDMVAVQKTLTMNSSSPAKNEAQKILKNTALFIETTAAKAKKDVSAELPPR